MVNHSPIFEGCRKPVRVVCSGYTLRVDARSYSCIRKCAGVLAIHVFNVLARDLKIEKISVVNQV